MTQRKEWLILLDDTDMMSQDTVELDFEKMSFPAGESDAEEGGALRDDDIKLICLEFCIRN